MCQHRGAPRIETLAGSCLEDVIISIREPCKVAQLYEVKDLKSIVWAYTIRWYVSLDRPPS